MTFTILTPGDAPLKGGKSDATDTKFGGHREHSTVSDAKDYTARTGNSPNKKENPVDETTRDIDDMSDVNSNFADPASERAKKREFSRREETADVQQNNEGVAIQSDPDNRPRMNEGSDGTQVPEATDLRKHKKPNMWQYDTSSTYEGEIS